MKEMFKYMCLLILLVFSFYYTDKISTMFIYKSDLMQKIVNHKESFERDYVNAKIEGNYIIPGVNGLKVNELDSYYNMKRNYEYQSSKLVFEEVEPQKSLEQNKQYIINKGNSIKKSVSIIVVNNPEVQNYLESKKIKANLAILYDNFDKESFLEQINYENNFKTLDILLDKYKLNTNICLVTAHNKDDCIKAKKYLVEETYYLDNVTIFGLDVNAGDIIMISDDLSLTNFKILLKNIAYRNLDIIYLSEMISEKRNI